MKVFLIFSCVFINFFVQHADSAAAIFTTKIGENLVLDVGRDVTEWRRVRNGVEETIKYCPEKSSEECNQWIDSEKHAVGDGREHIYENGTLIIHNFKESDSGDYFTHDELERLHYTVDGRIWRLARTKISVISS